MNHSEWKHDVKSSSYLLCNHYMENMKKFFKLYENTVVILKIPVAFDWSSDIVEAFFMMWHSEVVLECQSYVVVNWWQVHL